MKPVPTIIPEDQKSISLPPTAVMETIRTPRKPPTPRVLQKDQLSMFKLIDGISKFEDVSVEKLKKIRDGFDVCKDDKRILFFIGLHSKYPYGLWLRIA